MARCTWFLVALTMVGCGSSSDDKPKSGCTADAVGTSTGCADGLVCAEVSGGQPACFASVQIEGHVFDALDGTDVEGASVVALDANGGAISTVVFTEADGTYALPVPVPRASDGTPTDLAVTLRVSGSGYQTFPTPPRTALPIHLSDATPGTPDPNAKEGDPPPPYSVVNAATDVALIPLPGPAADGTIAGTVTFTGDASGILIVAEVGGQAVSTAVTDADGSFKLFNVPAGDVSITGYRSGVAVEAQTVSVATEPVEGVQLAGTTGGLTNVTGSVQIVNGGDCNATSVILVLESTFVENAARGEAPAGLRAGNVTGNFTIPDVPPGKYVVLAAFENDRCVRDPDICIAGTDIVHISVPQQAAIADSFKITGALAVRAPGASKVDTVTDANPTFSWEDDSSEDGYEVRVFDAFGEQVHLAENVPSAKGSNDATYTMTGVELTPGMLYQFRAYSWRTVDRCYISSTEDLLGVFVYQP